MRRSRVKEPQISIAPLIDMMFILLIFFLVTAHFEKYSVVPVERPRAASVGILSERPFVVTLSKDGILSVGGKRTDLTGLRMLVREALRGMPERAVIIDSDKGAPVGKLVEVLDECRIAGAKKISVAAEHKR
ncbi:MAG: biopolymer transporter ExbD [Planctomycetota bacterium]|nr:biopolymer transporter ExbD [Planctomycetota bacterium]